MQNLWKTFVFNFDINGAPSVSELMKLDHYVELTGVQWDTRLHKYNEFCSAHEHVQITL